MAIILNLLEAGELEVKGVSRIASIAGLGEKTKRKAIKMLNKIGRAHV